MLVASVLAAFAFQAAHASAKGIGPDYHGINAQVFSRLDPGLWEPHLRTMADANITLVRRDAAWGKVEPNAPVDGVRDYRWGSHDRFAAELAAHGMRWYPVLAYGTTWASGVAGPAGWGTPPRDPADYADYVRAFAARYGSRGSFWSEHPGLPRMPVRSYEVWNEPNVEKFFPGQSTAPERYADLYMAAAAGVRAADPNGQVLIGGLGSVGVGDFLRRMLARRPGLWSLVDAISYHPFGGEAGRTFDRIAALRSALVRLGAGELPIEVTETGWAATGSAEAHRSEQVRRLAEDLPRSNCGVTRFIPYTWNTPEATPDPEDWFGLANADGTLKPSGSAYVKAIRRTREGASPQEVLRGCQAAGDGRLALTVRPSPLRPSARRLRVSVRCSAGCRLSLRLVARSRAGTRAVSLGWTTVRAGRVAKIVRLRVPRERLAKLSPRRVTLRVRASGGGGAGAAVSRRIASPS
jgi:hypothetical protein